MSEKEDALKGESTAEYIKIEEAVRNLCIMGVPESAITLSVRIFYRDIINEVNVT